MTLLEKGVYGAQQPESDYTYIKLTPNSPSKLQKWGKETRVVQGKGSELHQSLELASPEVQIELS